MGIGDGVTIADECDKSLACLIQRRCRIRRRALELDLDFLSVRFCRNRGVADKGKADQEDQETREKKAHRVPTVAHELEG
jgi:hypothetical protein